MPHILRPYQLDAFDALKKYLRDEQGSPLVVIPTGGGKSLVIAELAQIACKAGFRTLVVTHVKELIRQNHDELLEQWDGPLAPVGIYSAGIGRRDVDESVIFCGVQSVYKNPGMFGKVDLVIVDEAHLVPHSGTGRYRTFFRELREINPALRVVGLTATHYRTNGGLLHKGKGRLFDDVCYEVSIEHLIDQGHLCKVLGRRPQSVIDVEGVKKAAGEFNQKQLAERVEDQAKVNKAIAEVVTVAEAEDRRHWLIFGVSVEHAYMIERSLRLQGVEPELIFGHTPKSERDDIIKRAKEGRVRAIVNVGVLTTGFNWPRCDLLAILRPTASPGLLVQMIGRVMRNFPGKENARLLDFGGNIERHGPISEIAGRITNAMDQKEDGKGAPLTKVCAKCEGYNLLAALQCAECGEMFPPPQERGVTHDTESADVDPIRGGDRIRSNVLETLYSFHSRPGVVPSMRVDYQLGGKRVSEWVCIQHVGVAKRIANAWWRSRGGEYPPPNDVEAALLRVPELLIPRSIEYRMELASDGRRYPRVKTAHFVDEETDDDELTEGDEQTPAGRIASTYAKAKSRSSGISSTLDELREEGSGP